MERLRPQKERGFTLVEVMLVVAIVGILAAIAVPLYANVQKRTRVAKVQADIRHLGTAIMVYSAHCGALPPVGPGTTGGCPAATADSGTLPEELTVAQTIGGGVAGPFINAIPTPPVGGEPTAWDSAYTYTVNADGAFTISVTGDGLTCDLRQNPLCS